MRKIVVMAIVFAMLAAGLGSVSVKAAPLYTGYREHLYCEYHTCDVDGNFTIPNEYGSNEITNEASTTIEVDGTPDLKAGFMKIYVANDNDYLYMIIDAIGCNRSSMSDGLIWFIDVDKDSDWNDSVDFAFEMGLGGLDQNRGDDGTIIVQNFTGYATSPNADYYHAIYEVGLPITAIGLELGETYPMGGFGGSPMWAWTDTMDYGNVTLTDYVEPPAPADEYLVFEEDDGVFINVTTSWIPDAEATLTNESKWFGDNEYVLTIVFSGDASNGYVNFTIKFDGVVSQIGGWLPDMIVYVWFTGGKYQLTEKTTNLDFDAASGRYSLYVGAYQGLSKMQIVVNPDAWKCMGQPFVKNID